MRATRAQADRVMWQGGDPLAAREPARAVTLFQSAVDDITVAGERVTGVVTQSAGSFEALHRGAYRPVPSPTG